VFTCQYIIPQVSFESSPFCQRKYVCLLFTVDVLYVFMTKAFYRVLVHDVRYSVSSFRCLLCDYGVHTSVELITTPDLEPAFRVELSLVDVMFTFSVTFRQTIFDSKHTTDILM